MKFRWFVIKQRVEILKNLIEIVAICTAGAWAYYTFVVKDKPSLEHRTKIDSELTWNEATSADICEAGFNVSLENIGTTAFDISKVRVRGWKFSALSLDGGETAKYIDVNKIQAKELPFFDTVYDSKDPPEGIIWTPFLGHYSPGVTWKQAFQFMMKKDPAKSVLFLAEVFEKGTEDSSLDATYSVGLICGAPVKEKTIEKQEH